LDRAGLRVPFFVRNFFRQDMDEPEDGDADDRRKDDGDPRDAVGERVERIAMEEGGVRASGCGEKDRQQGRYGGAGSSSGKWSWRVHAV